jgi:hypothetical protein
MQPFLAMIIPVSQIPGGPSGPVDPGYSPPWAQVPGGGPSRPPTGPVDPGYSPPWARPPVDPGYSPPWARPRPPGQGGGGPVDPGYSPPWARPGGGPVDPGYSPPWAQVPDHPPPIFFPPPGPIDPGYSPPWAQVPELPPTVPPATGGGEPIPVVWKTAWTPATGWIVVGVPQGPHVTPSKA